MGAPTYHRVGFTLSAKIAEGKFERALAFCEVGVRIHIAASEVPRVHVAVCGTVPSAERAATTNNANLLAMSAFYVAERTAMAMAGAFLESEFSVGYEDWGGFYEYYRIGHGECESFNYTAYKANGFEVINPQEVLLAPRPKRLAY